MKKIATLALVVSLGAAPAVFAAESQAELQKDAKIKMEQARATALKSARGKVKSEEIERENGKLIYSFDITTSKGVTEVNVDAMTGKVISKHHESAAKEAAEKKEVK